MRSQIVTIILSFIYTYIYIYVQVQLNSLDQNSFFQNFFLKDLFLVLDLHFYRNFWKILILTKNFWCSKIGFLRFLIFRALKRLNYLKTNALFIYTYDWEKIFFLPGLPEKLTGSQVCHSYFCSNFPTILSYVSACPKKIFEMWNSNEPPQSLF